MLYVTTCHRLVSLGVLSPVAHSELALPIAVVLEKDCPVRICGDFKATVNPACTTEQYPLPIIEDVFAQLHDDDCFSTLASQNIQLSGTGRFCKENLHH